MLKETAENLTKVIVYNMLTENTGRDICDSGNAYGRHWERNQKKSLPDFEEGAEAVLVVEEKWIRVTVGVFGWLNKCLTVDRKALRFNDYQTDKGRLAYLNREFKLEESDKPITDILQWNTSNYSFSPLSQAIAYTELIHKKTGDAYVVISIHNGCDVRGGYTKPKLFKFKDRDDCRTFWLMPTIDVRLPGQEISFDCDDWYIDGELSSTEKVIRRLPHYVNIEAETRTP